MIKSKKEIAAEIVKENGLYSYLDISKREKISINSLRVLASKEKWPRIKIGSRTYFSEDQINSILTNRENDLKKEIIKCLV